MDASRPSRRANMANIEVDVSYWPFFAVFVSGEVDWQDGRMAG